ncbi:hypothetical protein G647_01951 [Cladophialophora carrionii CBS 160.54]|uniref:Cytochrome P450 n=1 Tax=Cladophialophora carrionii CBS 160.54 TaxID=1279043 RepID=V9DT49_9EURO|nr:uncharacterized protein G647_01951 [Cladophialophora carrionii CBS 160.54]ETI29498.1 hypothetical protein G647_01951 [Cladophialophora carrionii CBS 160.54]
MQGVAFLGGSSLAFTAFAALFFVAFTVLLQRYLHLRHIPGPLLASLTDLWLTYKFWFGEGFAQITSDLHRKYGPIVRMGPNRLIFCNASAISVIYRTTDVMPKVSFGEPHIGPHSILHSRSCSADARTSFVTILDEKRMSAIKRLLLGNLTINSFLQQESELDRTLSSLMKYLEDTEEGVEIGKTFGYWAFDTISRVALSEDQAFLSQQKDCGATLKGASRRLAHAQYWCALPALERLIFKNPLMQRMQSSSALGTLAAQKMQARLRQEKETDLEDQVDLLGKYLTASRRDPDLVKPVDVIGFLVSTMHAGSETTGQAVAGILSVLLKHPKKMAKLEEEILSAELGDMPQFGDANKLPYLDSVIREFGRFRGGGLTLIERTVPGDGAMIGGIWIPGGTNVSVSTTVLNMNPEIWGPNPEQFVPERWIGWNK